MSRLPLETVFHIIHLVCDSTEYKASLVILARVSSPVQQEAERLLYGSVVIDSDNTRLIALIATISRVPRLAHLVKSLELMSLQSLATMAFFNLMNAALVKTVELRTLRIGRRRADFVYFIFNPTCQWIFDGCTFKLRIFAVHFLFDNDLIAFLVRQSEIYHLSIHPQLSRIIYNLPPEILPVLSVLEASSMHSAYPIMKQRQVTHLRLRGFHLSLGGQSIITAVMLKRVRVCYMDSETFSSHQLISWDHLSGEAPHMKSIGCIGITELTAEKFYRIVSRFHDLRTLACSISSFDENRILDSLAVACPSLSKIAQLEHESEDGRRHMRVLWNRIGGRWIADPHPPEGDLWTELLPRMDN